MCTNKQQVFVEEYLKCWNATEAAITAGYSERSAYSIGHRMLKNDEVLEEIKARITEKSMSADEVIIRLAEQARNNIGDFITVDDGSWTLDLDAIKENGHLVKRIKNGPHGPEIELHDAQAALIQLGKVHGLFVDRQEVTGKDGAPLTVRYVNDWRDNFTHAASGAGDSQDTGEEV